MRTTKTSSMRKMKTKTNTKRKTMRVFSLGHEERKPEPRRSEESTYVTIKGPPNMVGGVIRAGMARFNELYKLVKKDRRCPRAAAMEK